MSLISKILNKDSRKDLIYYFFKKLPMIVVGKLRGKLIYAYWQHSLNNFGDLLTPMLLRYYGFTPVFAYPRKAQVVSVGTLLGFMSPDFSGIIMGAGINQPISKLFPNATVLGLRGELTKKMLSLQDRNITLGDPGLLVSRIFPKRQNKKWKLGIVPHLSEKEHKIIKKWKISLGDDVKIIDVLQNPETVIREIDCCEHIISSSLHGLVVADSLEIPNIRFIIEDTYEFNYFRFEDYYSALGVKYDWIDVDGNETLEDLLKKLRDDFSMLEPIKDNLDKMFREFVDNKELI